METLVTKIGRHRRALTMEELFALKPYFGVSAQALAYRCKDLAIITEAVYREFFKSFSRLSWRKQEPMTLPAERPVRFARLCYRALAEECISEAKAAELLQVPVRDLGKRLHEMTGLYLQ